MVGPRGPNWGPKKLREWRAAISLFPFLPFSYRSANSTCLPTRCPRVVQGWGARDPNLVLDWCGRRGLDQVSNSLQIISEVKD